MFKSAPIAALPRCLAIGTKSSSSRDDTATMTTIDKRQCACKSEERGNICWMPYLSDMTVNYRPNRSYLLQLKPGSGPVSVCSHRQWK